MEADDVAIASLGTPPDDLQPLAAAARSTAPPASAPAPAATTLITGPTVPSFQGKTMRAVLEESVALGVPVDIVGSGIARGQAPPPGSPLNPGERVRVQFQ